MEVPKQINISTKQLDRQISKKHESLKKKFLPNSSNVDTSPCNIKLIYKTARGNH